VDAILPKGGAVLITADHGNSEELANLQTGEIDKEHSTNPVPFIAVSKKWEGQTNPTLQAVGGDLSLLPPVGMLADVAPTILAALSLEPPAEMTGRSLL
jgi:2,3-bisphosphoglycerate-independent phosphoglycerate mutase